MNDYTYNTMIPYVQLRTNVAICYNQYEGNRFRNNQNSLIKSQSFKMSQAFADNVQNLKETVKYTGKMTAGAKKRLTKAISLLVTSSPSRYEYSPITKKTSSFKLSFITLTLPNVEKAKDAKFCHKHMLEPTLLFLRRYHGLKSYVWKCELQKNGSVHYHISSDCFIPFTILRDHWNYLANKNGLLEEFEKQYGHKNPNSVDIHSTKDIRNMEAYLIKYVAKEYQNEQQLSGKVWDASLNLKSGKYFKSEIDNRTLEAIEKAIEDKDVQVKELDSCTVIRFPSQEYVTYYFEHLMQSFIEHNKQIRQWERQTKPQTQLDLKKSTTSITKLTTESQLFLFHLQADGQYIYLN